MNHDAWRHYLRARLFGLIRRDDDALEGYREALRADPHAVPAAHRLAFLLAKRGRLSDAVRQLETVVAHEPKNADAWYNLGFLRDRLQEHTLAIEAFQRAVELNPKLDVAWYGLGMAHGARHEYEPAAQAFERVVQLKPMNGHAWYALGMTQHRLQQPDKVKGVVEHLDRFDRHQARRLIHDSGRTDLAPLIADLHHR
jgi:tetratricopeptide (TPR) repeat protein